MNTYILVIDDEDALCEILRFSLEKEGYRVKTASSADEALRLVPPKIMSLEQALDFIDTDELLEVTPVSLRIRKKILDPTMRKRAAMKK